MSSYELNFPINAGSPEPINKIAQAVKSVSDSTRTANPAMTDLDAKIKSTTATATAGSAALTNWSLSARNLGTTLQSHTIPQVAAASAAIRGLEGSMNIRAAERFLTTIKGMGPVLQAAFPLFGALAFAEVIGQMIGHAGKLYNAWNPIVEAQRESLKLLKESVPELERLIRSTERLTAQERARQFGAQYGFKLQMQVARGDVVSDERNIANIQGQIAAQQVIIAAGTSAGTGPSEVIGKGGAIFTRPGTAGGKSAAARAAEEKLIGLQALLENAQFQRDQTILEGNAAKAGLDKDIRDKANERERKLKAFEDQAYEKSLDPVNRIFAQRDVLVGELGPGSRNRATAAALVAASAELARQGAAGEGAGFRANLRGLQYQESVFAPEIKGLNAYSGDISRSFRETGSEVARAQMSATLQGTMRRGTGLTRLAEINAQPGMAGQVGASQVAFQQRMATAKALYDFELQESAALASKGKTEYDRLNIARVENAKAYWRFENEKQNASLDLELRISEIRRAQLLGDRSAAGSVYDAILGGRSGISGLARNFATSQGRTIFQNATMSLFTQARGALGGIFGGDGPGGLFKGTVFGQDPVKTATDANTLATIANTTALVGVAAGLGVTVPASAAGGGGVLPAIGGTFGSGSSSPFSAIFNAIRGDGTGPIGTIPNGLPNGPLATLNSSGTGPAIARVRNGAFYTAGGDSSIAGALFNPDASGTDRFISGAASAGALYAGYSGVSSGIRQGGARGTIGAVGAAAGTAAAFDPEPISKAVLAMIAVTSQIVTGIMGDPKQNRSDQINRVLKYGQFVSPVALNASVDQTGNFSDYDRFGGFRSSPFSGIPQVEQPYFDYRNNTTVPGRETSQYGPPINVNVQTMDAKSFMDHSPQIAAAVARDFQTDGVVLNAMRKSGL